MYTVGHSTRPLDELLAIVTGAGTATVADVRRFPESRRHPWFAGDALAVSLAAVGVGYSHLGELGGRRSPDRQSVNTGWHNASFRGYADYMATPPFCAGIERLLALASPLVIMCAEAPWWRCHRALIADYLTAMGLEVRHLGERGRIVPHPGTGPAVFTPGHLEYDAPQRSLPLP